MAVRPHRLAVRTSGSHPENRGPTPLEATKLRQGFRSILLTDEQKKYLASIEDDRTVRIYPYDRVIVIKIQDSIIERVREKSPTVNITFLGASALGISGQKDIDAYIFCPFTDLPIHLPFLISQFGEPKITESTSIAWSWNEAGYNVELYLTDPKSQTMQNQLKVFEILNKNSDLLTEYEELKQEFDGNSYRDYQKAKYEFYNRILHQS